MMSRKEYKIKFRERTAVLSFSRPIDALEFDSLLNTAFCTNQSGSWATVIGFMSCGVDWPAWWPRYERQRNRYHSLLAGAPTLNALTMSAAKLKEEKRRRYGLCFRSGITTCEDVHYPDFFEIEELVLPYVLDEIREDFPVGVFGPYIMACPPLDRLIDPGNPGPLNGVWSAQRDFFIEKNILVPWKKIPPEVIATSASNQNLRTVITRHGGKVGSSKVINEISFIEISRENPSVAVELRELSIPKHQWCRMPPPNLSWKQLQAYRWLSRGLCGSLFDLFSGLNYTELSAPE